MYDSPVSAAGSPLARSVRLSQAPVPCPLCGVPCTSKGALLQHLESCVASSMQFGMATGASPAVAAELAARRAATLARSSMSLLEGEGDNVVPAEVDLFQEGGSDVDEETAQLSPSKQASADASAAAGLRGSQRGSGRDRVTPEHMAAYDL